MNGERSYAGLSRAQAQGKKLRHPPVGRKAAREAATTLKRLAMTARRLGMIAVAARLLRDARWLSRRGG